MKRSVGVMSMSSIKVLTLGAGQDVGRSCLIVTLGGRRVMFDCGMHMGYRDHRRFPDWKQLGTRPGEPASSSPLRVRSKSRSPCRS